MSLARIERLKALTNQALLAKALREFPVDDAGLVAVLDVWRDKSREGRTMEDLEHFCKTGFYLDNTTSSMERSAVPSVPGAGIDRQLKIIERLAPGITAEELLTGLIAHEMAVGRSTAERNHFAAHGFYQAHTAEQREREGRLIGKLAVA
ncbi:MAG: hypothetical protein LAP21_23995 [Acidobacteriia bacterium]|nr:hypothetical protein [Terriglobia bacterium]